MPPFFRHNIKLHGGKNAAIWAKFGGCACHRVLHIEIYEKLTQVDSLGFFLLSIYNQISHLLIFIVSKSTHVGIMQMRRRRLDRSQNQSILIKLPNFGARIFIHCDKHRRTFDLHRIGLDLTIIQMSLLFHSNKRCLFRVQWTLSKTRQIDGSMH